MGDNIHKADASLRATTALAVAGMALCVSATMACEPVPRVDERVRTGPALTPVDSCRDLFDLVKARVTRDYDDRILAQAFTTMQSGSLAGQSSWPIYADPQGQYELLQAAPRGTASMLILDDSVAVTTSRGVTLIPFDDTGFMEPSTIDLLDDVELGGYVTGIAARENGTLLAFTTLWRDSPAGRFPGEDSAYDADKSLQQAPLLVVDQILTTGGVLTRGERLIESGQLMAVAIGADAYQLALSYTPPLPFLNTYPLGDDSIFGFGGSAAAVERAQLDNRQRLAGLDEEGMWPVRGDSLTAFVGTETTGPDCSDVQITEDGTGVTFTTILERRFDGATMNYRHVLSEPSSARFAGDTAVVLARAQGASWHLGTDLPPMSDVFQLDPRGPGPGDVATRITGWASLNDMLVPSAESLALVVAGGVRNAYTYAYADATLVTIPRRDNKSVSHTSLLFPLSAPLTAMADGGHIAIGLDNGRTTHFSVDDERTQVAGLTEGIVRFYRQLDGGEHVLVSSLSTGAVVAERRTANLVPTSSIEFVPPDPLLVDSGKRDVVAPYDLVQQSMPTFYAERKILLYPTMSTRWTNDGQILTTNRLNVLSFENDDMTLVGFIEAQNAQTPTDAPSSAPPIGMSALVGDTIIVHTDANVSVYAFPDLGLVDTIPL